MQANEEEFIKVGGVVMPSTSSGLLDYRKAKISLQRRKIIEKRLHRLENEVADLKAIIRELLENNTKNT